LALGLILQVISQPINHLFFINRQIKSNSSPTAW